MGELVTFDPSRRRRPTRGLTSTDRQRIEYQERLAELEYQRSELRERLRHVVQGSELRTHLLCDLAIMNEDIEWLHELLYGGCKVVRIGRRA